MMVRALMVRVKEGMELVEEHHISGRCNDLRNSAAVSQYRTADWNSTTLHFLEQRAQKLHGHLQHQHQQQQASHNRGAKLVLPDRYLRSLHPHGQSLWAALYFDLGNSISHS